MSVEITRASFFLVLCTFVYAPRTFCTPPEDLKRLLTSCAVL